MRKVLNLYLYLAYRNLRIFIVKLYLSSEKIRSEVLKLTTSMIDVMGLKLYGLKVT